jgi:hypothetical protein
VNIEKIQKLLKLLSSNNDGEVVAAARAILRTLHAEGADIHALAERVEGRKLSQAEMQRIYDKAFADGKKSVEVAADFSSIDPSPYEMACEVKREAYDRLNSWEQGLIDTIVRWYAHKEPSEKQQKYVRPIYYRTIGRRR